MEAELPGGETATLTCGFLLMCSGYYRYDQSYQAELDGIENFGGQVVHPQFWPEDLDYAGKRIVVIGSGATAVTLVPALAETAEHVTMLQRSPTYILAMPAEDGIAVRLRKLLGTRRGYAAARWKNVAVTTLIYKLSRRRPDMIRGWIRQMAVKQLPDGYDVDTHFKPVYNPWDQRLCLVPDGDLFEVIRAGRASVATDRVKTFTERAVVLESGAELEADIVVTATGLQLLALGGTELTVDGAPVRLPETMAYKGMMLSGVPNFAFTIGYTNASWTLKADLVSEFACRLLKYMDARGYDTCVPVNDDPAVTPQPLLDFQAGVRAQVHRRIPAGRLARPVAAGPELRARRGDAAARQDRRRLDAVRASRHPVRSVVICSIVTNRGAESLPGRLGTRRGAACTAIMPRIRLAVTVLVAGAALAAAPLSAAQARALPVNYDFATGALAGFLFPQTPPPGADNFGCQPSSAHPDPVILVNGTFGNQDDNWQAASPLLANHGYCVFTFNYGGSSASAVVQGTGDIAASAGQLASFVNLGLRIDVSNVADALEHLDGPEAR